MKILGQANEIASAMLKVKGVVPGRTTIPIIECVLIEATNRLSVTATSLDLYATATCDAQIVTPGTIAVRPEIIATMKAMGRREVSLTLEGNRMTLGCGKSRYDFATLPAEDFPTAPQPDGAVEFDLDAQWMRIALDKTRLTVSTEETRAYLNGVHFDTEGSQLLFVSTDGHRLVRVGTDLPEGLSDTFGAIVPTPAVKEICAILDGNEETASICLSPKIIRVTSGNATITAKLIEGVYPDYRRAIPRDRDTNFTTTPAAIREAWGRMQSIYDPKAPATLCRTNGSGVDFLSARSGTNEGAEFFEASVVEPTEFGINGSYLAGLVSMWPSDAVLNVSCPDAGSTILITSDDVPGQTQVCMPMRY